MSVNTNVSGNKRLSPSNGYYSPSDLPPARVPTNSTTSLHKAAGRSQPAPSFFTQSSGFIENSQDLLVRRNFASHRLVDAPPRQAADDNRPSPTLRRASSPMAQNPHPPAKHGNSIHLTFPLPDLARDSYSDSHPEPKPALPSRLTEYHSKDIRTPLSSYRPSDARSVASSDADVGLTFQGNEDETTARVLRSFEDLKRAKKEIEKQREENAHLIAQVAVARSEKAEAITRLNRIKEATVKASDVHSKSLAVMRSTVDALKAQSQEVFAFASNAQSTMPEVDGMRQIVKESTLKLETLLSEDGPLARAAEARQIMTDLQTECAKTRQANDLLRDKLTDLTSQLVEARDRVRDVEGSHADQTNTLRVAVADLSSANSTIVAQNSELKRVQSELANSLIAGLRLEDKCKTIEAGLHALEVDAGEKHAALKQVQELQQRNAELTSLVDEKETRLVALLSMKTEILSQMSSSNEQHFEIGALRKALADQTSIGEGHQSKCMVLESDLQSSQNTIRNLETELAATAGREQANLDFINHLTAEKTGSLQQVATLQVALKEAVDDGMLHKDRAHQAQMRSQALQERFDDQAATLKLIRESHGDMQERLINAERAFATNLEAETGKLQRDLVVLQEQHSSLKSRFEEAKGQIQREQDLLAKIQVDCEERLKSERDSAQANLLHAQERMLQTEHAHTISHKECEELRERLSQAHEDKHQIQTQLDASKAVASRREVDINGLSTRIRALEAENAHLSEPGKSISERYKINTLTDEEKTFVDALHEDLQSTHKKELAEKQNELRRRGNTITGLEKKVTLLEKNLARHLKTEAQKPVTKSEGQSIINLARYANSSIPPTSPPRLSQAPDSDEASPNDAASTRTRAAPSRSTVISAAAAVSTGETQAKYTTPPPAPALPPPSPVKWTGRVTFARLATNDSDEIADFEDPTAGPSLHSLGKHNRPLAANTVAQAEGADSIEEVEEERPARRLKAGKKPDTRSVDAKKVVIDQSTVKPRRPRRNAK
ncbi:hypothetical protein FA95DRAFT_1680555 [Auriscalpium vulgare]|uniref:Uncharacterized protein n=1 Tax=Auriscalpium vulgare TaxID=40419 RepID=A0ACB8RP78_9AGAM|nr:hypothetical protein FA95DRAFT_1680555 [Auriscalpium vulgare]